MTTATPSISDLADAEATLREIDRQRREVESTITDCERRVRSLALDAALNEAGAQIDLDSARQLERAARERLADLAVAREEAATRVRAAQQDAADRALAERRRAARVLAHRRVAAAERLDRALAEAESAFRDLDEACLRLDPLNDITKISEMQMRLGIRFELAVSKSAPTLGRAIDVRRAPGELMAEGERSLWSRFLSEGSSHA